MLVYIVMLVFSIVMLFIAEKFKEKKVIKIGAFILAGLSFFIVSAIRYDLGTDYIRRYAEDYIKMGKGINIPNLELGYKLFAKACLFFTKDYVIIFVITSAIIIFLTFYTIYKESPYPILSVVIYFLMGYFFHSLNIMREYLAISILLFSYPYLVNKKYIVFAICAIIAFLFHSSSAIILIAVLLCNREVFDLKRTLIMSVILLLAGRFLWKYVGTYLINHTRFASYTKDTSKFSNGVLRKVEIIVNLILYLTIYYLYKNSPDKGRKEKFFLNMQACSLLFMIAASAMSLFFRISFYFAIFNIISIPYFFKKSDIETKKKMIVLSIIMVTMLGHFTKKNILKNTDEVTPYKTIFSVENRLRAE